MRRGRPRKNGPTITTTVRIPIAEWQWVKDQRLEFTSLLRKQIRSEMIADGDPLVHPTPPTDPLRAWIAERNRQGLLTTQSDIDAKKKELLA